MASTITVQQVVDWARTQTKLIPIVGVGGFSNEPALTIANMVVQEILAYPYNWKFNRASLASFDTVENQQEYTATGVQDIGWLERGWAQDKNSTVVPKPGYPIEVVQDLPKTGFKDNPSRAAVDHESGSDSIVRLDVNPGSYVWTIMLDYQKKAPLITSLAGTWTPIPDELAFVYRQGFLAMAFKHADDARYAQEYQLFMAAIAKALGLKDAEQTAASFYPDRPILIG
jgi:hypothetical protein